MEGGGGCVAHLCVCMLVCGVFDCVYTGLCMCLCICRGVGGGMGRCMHASVGVLVWRCVYGGG